MSVSQEGLDPASLSGKSISDNQEPSAIHPADSIVPFVPTNEQERELVREQLERIVSSVVFRNSKRYTSVLRYIVSRTLDGQGDQIKERTIGTDVFGRAHDYDTASDHAVRSAVGEVRKRLAQYYQEEGGAADVRIEVQPGSYVPQFKKSRPRCVATLRPAPVDLSHENVMALLPSAAQSSATRMWLRRMTYVLAPILLIAGVLFFYGSTGDPFESFWTPVLSSRTPILLCIGNIGGHQSAEDQKPSGQPLTVHDFHELPSETVHVADAATLSRVAGFIQAKGKPVQIVAQSEATYTDLQNGPAVLIGLMNNDWTVRLIQKLRFTVERPAGPIVLIRDHENPSRTDWAMDYSKPYMEVTKDYALVLRVRDPKTEQMVVAIAGISVFGTTAAGEFLTDPNDIKKIQGVAPRGWEHKNLELVLSTDVIRGKPGRGSIIASSFW